MIRLICFMRVLSGHVGGSKSKLETNRFIINEITINPEPRTEDDDDAYSCNASEKIQRKLTGKKGGSSFEEGQTAPLNAG